MTKYSQVGQQVVDFLVNSVYRLSNRPARPLPNGLKSEGTLNYGGFFYSSRLGVN